MNFFNGWQKLLGRELHIYISNRYLFNIMNEYVHRITKMSTFIYLVHEDEYIHSKRCDNFFKVNNRDLLLVFHDILMYVCLYLY